MSLKIRDTAALPPKAWIFKNPEDGQILKHVYFSQLQNMVKGYRRANSFPIGSNFQEQFEANLCENRPEFCFEFTPPSLITKAGTFAVALGRWAKSGFKVRSAEEAEAVLNICRACPHYAGETGLLKVACRVCGCSRKKVFLASEHCPDNPPRW